MAPTFSAQHLLPLSAPVSVTSPHLHIPTAIQMRPPSPIALAPATKPLKSLRLSRPGPTRRRYQVPKSPLEFKDELSDSSDDELPFVPVPAKGKSKTKPSVYNVDSTSDSSVHSVPLRDRTSSPAIGEGESLEQSSRGSIAHHARCKSQWSSQERENKGKNLFLGGWANSSWTAHCERQRNRLTGMRTASSLALVAEKSGLHVTFLLMLHGYVRCCVRWLL